MTALTLSALAPLPVWVAWQTEPRPDGKPTKVPYSPSGRKARADAPATWGLRTEAEARARQLPKPLGEGGTGIEFADLPDQGLRLGGVDLDTCRNPKTGEIDSWAQDVITALASYTEVSPSQTGAKIFFVYSAADLPTLRAAMGTAQWGKQFKRGVGEHPPAIELHLGNRYFAVTDAKLPESPDELRHVDTSTLLQLIQVAGPAFAERNDRTSESAVGTEEPSPDAAKPVDLQTRIREAASKSRLLRERWSGDWDGLKDQSRSGRAFALAAALKRAGFDYHYTCEALRLHPGTNEWAATKGAEAGGRELSNIWQHIREPEQSAPRPQWLYECQTDKEGEPRGNLANAMKALRDDAAFTDLFAYDLMQRTAILRRPVPNKMIDLPQPNFSARSGGS